MRKTTIAIYSSFKSHLSTFLRMRNGVLGLIVMWFVKSSSVIQLTSLVNVVLNSVLDAIKKHTNQSTVIHYKLGLIVFKMAKKTQGIG